MFGLGKKRSKLGAFLDHKGLTQEWLVTEAGLSRNAIMRLCDGDRNNDKAQVTSKVKVVSALRKHGYDVRMHDFWS